MHIAISGKGSNEKALLKNFLALMPEKSKTANEHHGVVPEIRKGVEISLAYIKKNAEKGREE